ncbi:hypothetical protein ANTRET_LOCUS138 [Anthophora retusa]
MAPHPRISTFARIPELEVRLFPVVSSFHSNRKAVTTTIRVIDIRDNFFTIVGSEQLIGSHLCQCLARVDQ